MLCLPLLSLPSRHLQPARIKAAAHLRVTALDGHFSGLTLASQQGLTQLVPLSLKPIFFLLAPRDHPLHSPGVTLPLASGSVSSAALCSFQPLNGQGLQSPALRPLMCSVCPGPHPSPGFSITQPDGSHISISGWHLSCLLDCVCTSSTHGYPGISSVATFTGTKQNRFSSHRCFQTREVGPFIYPAVQTPSPGIYFGSSPYCA